MSVFFHFKNIIIVLIVLYFVCMSLHKTICKHCLFLLNRAIIQFILLLISLELLRNLHIICFNTSTVFVVIKYAVFPKMCVSFVSIEYFLFLFREIIMR